MSNFAKPRRTAAMDRQQLARLARLRFLYSTCTVAELPDDRAVLTVVLHSVSLAISAYFVFNSIRDWRTKDQSQPHIRDPALDVNPSIRDSNGRKMSSSSSLVSLLKSTKRPTCSPCFTKVSIGGLIMSAWIITTTEQIARVTLYLTQLLECPRYECWLSTPTANAQCPTLYPAFLVVLWAQPIGLCLFVLATMIRFLRVFSLLSHTRHTLLVVGCLLTIAATIARLLAVALHQLLPIWLIQEEGSPGPPILLNAPLVTAVLGAFHWTLAVSVGVYALCALFSIVIGLRYIQQVRAQVDSAAYGRNLDHAGFLHEQATCTFEKPRRHQVIQLLLYVAVICIVCLLVALAFRTVSKALGSQQLFTAVLSIGLKIVMALMSLAMRKLCC